MRPFPQSKPTCGNERYLLVTIDTEVDKDPAWRISNPPAFTSVTRGVPDIFTPLFRRYKIKPTYLLSYEILEDQAACQILAALGDEAELGTHLHVEFVPPKRRLFPDNMGGQSADAIQAQESHSVEGAKLANLTDRFRECFGYAPLSFRAGRYGISLSTPLLLAELGYLVDSSVTPGLYWNYAEGVVDFRSSSREPHWLETPHGRLLELPISIMPGGAMAPLLTKWQSFPASLFKRLLGKRGRHIWLRPSWGTGEDLVRYVERSNESFLVMMLHSTEIIPGASPYARTQAQADRIIANMDHLFAYAQLSGIRFCTMTEAAYICKALI